jgi:hypothetical protein
LVQFSDLILVRSFVFLVLFLCHFD